MRQSGFTAIELLIGMAIIAIIATLAVPTLGSLIESSRLTSTTNMLVEAFMTARSEAVKRGEPVRVVPGDGAIGVRVLVTSDESLVRSFDNEIGSTGAESPIFLKFSEDIEFVEYQANGIRAGGSAAVEIYVCNRAGTKGAALIWGDRKYEGGAVGGGLPMNIPRKSTGFSMIEVLIAVLILAIGLLGVAALQMASLTQGQESYFRSQATALADDLASRIRAGRQSAKATAPSWGAPTWADDPAGAAAAYAALYSDSPYVCNVAPPTNCREDEIDGAAVACSLEDLVAYEQWDMCTQAATLIPEGRVHVATNGLRTTIAVSWLATEAREDTGEQEIRNPVCNEVFVLTAERDCVVVESLP